MSSKYEIGKAYHISTDKRCRGETWQDRIIQEGIDGIFIGYLDEKAQFYVVTKNDWDQAINMTFEFSDEYISEWELKITKLSEVTDNDTTKTKDPMKPFVKITELQQIISDRILNGCIPSVPTLWASFLSGSSYFMRHPFDDFIIKRGGAVYNVISSIDDWGDEGTIDFSIIPKYVANDEERETKRLRLITVYFTNRMGHIKISIVIRHISENMNFTTSDIEWAAMNMSDDEKFSVVSKKMHDYLNSNAEAWCTLKASITPNGSFVTENSDDICAIIGADKFKMIESIVVNPMIHLVVKKLGDDIK